MGKVENRLSHKGTSDVRSIMGAGGRAHSGRSQTRPVAAPSTPGRTARGAHSLPPVPLARLEIDGLGGSFRTTGLGSGSKLFTGLPLPKKFWLHEYSIGNQPRFKTFSLINVSVLRGAHKVNSASTSLACPRGAKQNAASFAGKLKHAPPFPRNSSAARSARNASCRWCVG
jgi:hypothetical protein